MCNNDCWNCNEQAINDIWSTKKRQIDQFVERSETAAENSEASKQASAGSAAESKKFRDEAEIAASTAVAAEGVVLGVANTLQDTTDKLEQVADELGIAIAGIAVTSWFYTTVSENQSVIPVPANKNAVDVQSIYIEGIRKSPFRGFEFDKTAMTITLAEPLPLGLEIEIVLGTYNSDNPNDFAVTLASNNGASLVGTTSGFTAQEELNANSGSFQDGAKLLNKNNRIIDRSTNPAQLYIWDGLFPKAVPVGSTPETSGGVGNGAWISVGDAALRIELSSDSDGQGASMVSTREDGTVQAFIDDIKVKVEEVNDATQTALGTALREVENIKDIAVGASDVAVAAATDAKTAAGVTYTFATYAELSVVTGANGLAGRVFADTGTHTDPVSGDIVDNNGLYTWNPTTSVWQWQSAELLSQKADRSELKEFKDDIGDPSAIVRTTNEYSDISTFSWGKVLESGEVLPGTLHGIDGLPADENVAAYAKKGVSVFSDSGDSSAGHAIIKDDCILMWWNQSGHVSYLPPFTKQAQAAVITSPVMILSQLPESVRSAIEPCAKLACKYTLNQQLPSWIPLAGGAGFPANGFTMTLLESYYVTLAAVASWIRWVDAGYTTWDEAGIGVSYANAVAWTAQGVELVAAGHIANGGWWGGPMPPWSDDTENVALTFASQAAEAARNVSNYADLIWSHLSDAAKAKVSAMVVHEANRFVGYAPKYLFSLPNRYGAVVTNYPGDSKSEELAWNIGILARALVLDPSNENAERWTERMVTMQIAALGDRNDLADPMPLNGLAPRDTLRGTNVNPTRLVENHNVADGQDISRWYSMAALSGSEWMIRTFFRANQPIPAVALWHMKDTIRAVEYMPDGSLWDMDWREPVGELSYAPLIAYMFAEPNEDYITQFLHRAAIFAGQQDPETGALPDGAFNWPVYGSSQPGEFLQMIMLSALMNDPLTAPHSTNAHYTHLTAIYRSV